MGYNTDGLTYNTLRDANIRRLPEFRNSKGELTHSKEDGSDWSPAEWLEAVVGELGEYANFAKKFRRGDISEPEFLHHAGKELADVAIYLDILAYQLGINLGKEIIHKFNVVSDRVGASVYIREDGSDFFLPKIKPTILDCIVYYPPGESTLKASPSAGVLPNFKIAAVICDLWRAGLCARCDEYIAELRDQNIAWNLEVIKLSDKSGVRAPTETAIANTPKEQTNAAPV